jgi:hypothetical protein
MAARHAHERDHDFGYRGYWPVTAGTQVQREQSSAFGAIWLVNNKEWEEAALAVN